MPIHVRRSTPLARLPRWLPLVVVGGALLVGCGEQPTASVAAPTDASGDVASAPASATPTATCWSEGDRSVSNQGGTEMAQYSKPPAMAIDPSRRYTATLQTNKGDIAAELYPGDAPQTVNNFVCLARDGYFDGTPFHRVVKGFVVQGGDPTGTGSGGPGYKFSDEPVSKEYERGILAMANAGPNTNGSQFFIVLGDLRQQLPKNYTIFGKVTSGMDAVDAIAAVPTRPGAGGENSTPTEPVTLEKVTIEEAQ